MRKFEFNGKEYLDVVSVIIPLYKSFDSSRVKISLDSLKNQEKVNLEILVAEQSDNQTFNNEKGISHIFIPNNQANEQEHSIPGLVRNIAAKNSSGSYLYNSDGDIVYNNPYYFAEILELIKTGKGVSLFRPPMRRMPIEDFKSFKEIWEKFGFKEAIGKLDLTEKFSAKMPESKVSIMYFRKKESGKLKTFLYTNTDFKKYKENPSTKGSEPKYSTLDVHAGATFMERSQFFGVGGFCENFAAWGCHDADLQWKLRNKYNLIQIPNFPEYEVIHLDHKREYFNKEQWKKNLELQKERREKGANQCILEDLKNGDESI